MPGGIDPLTRSGVVPDLPSIGKDMNKMHQQSFYNPNNHQNVGSAGGHSVHDVSGGGLHIQDQNSPGP